MKNSAKIAIAVVVVGAISGLGYMSWKKGQTTAVQNGAFVMAMRMKGETLPEITGFLHA
ncbi:MAG: hypothetical protein ABMA00_04125, partial [Gemmatimonas sp.]